jgi:hypothetical protein
LDITLEFDERLADFANMVRLSPFDLSSNTRKWFLIESNSTDFVYLQNVQMDLFLDWNASSGIGNGGPSLVASQFTGATTQMWHFDNALRIINFHEGANYYLDLDELNVPCLSSKRSNVINGVSSQNWILKDEP